MFGRRVRNGGSQGCAPGHARGRSGGATLSALALGTLLPHQTGQVVGDRAVVIVDKGAGRCRFGRVGIGVTGGASGAGVESGGQQGKEGDQGEAIRVHGGFLGGMRLGKCEHGFNRVSESNWTSRFQTRRGA